MERRLSIAIDMDDVLCDTTEHLILLFNQRFEQHITANDLGHMMKKDEWSKEMTRFVLDEFNKPGFARNLKVKEGAVDVVQALTNKYEV